MKTTLFLLTLIFAVNMNAQESEYDTLYIHMTKFSPTNIGTQIEDGEIPYIVGSYKFSEYEVETRACSIEESMTLSNGRRIAGLSCILFDKSEYIGGNLIFGDDTTIITEITVLPVGEGVEFTVKGEDFIMSFTLKTGLILKYENGYATFNTENKGIWTIQKKV